MRVKLAMSLDSHTALADGAEPVDHGARRHARTYRHRRPPAPQCAWSSIAAGARRSSLMSVSQDADPAARQPAARRTRLRACAPPRARTSSPAATAVLDPHRDCGLDETRASSTEQARVGTVSTLPSQGEHLAWRQYSISSGELKTDEVFVKAGTTLRQGDPCAPGWRTRAFFMMRRSSSSPAPARWSSYHRCATLAGVGPGFAFLGAASASAMTSSWACSRALPAVGKPVRVYRDSAGRGTGWSAWRRAGATCAYLIALRDLDTARLNVSNSVAVRGAT